MQQQITDAERLQYLEQLKLSVIQPQKEERGRTRGVNADDDAKQRRWKSRSLSRDCRINNRNNTGISTTNNNTYQHRTYSNPATSSFQTRSREQIDIDTSRIDTSLLSFSSPANKTQHPPHSHTNAAACDNEKEVGTIAAMMMHPSRFNSAAQPSPSPHHDLHNHHRNEHPQPARSATANNYNVSKAPGLSSKYGTDSYEYEDVTIAALPAAPVMKTRAEGRNFFKDEEEGSVSPLQDHLRVDEHGVSTSPPPRFVPHARCIDPSATGGQAARTKDTDDMHAILMQQLRQLVPSLSPSFSCSLEDAKSLSYALHSSSGASKNVLPQQGGSTSAATVAKTRSARTFSGPPEPPTVPQLVSDSVERLAASQSNATSVDSAAEDYFFTTTSHQSSSVEGAETKNAARASTTSTGSVRFGAGHLALFRVGGGIGGMNSEALDDYITRLESDLKHTRQQLNREQEHNGRLKDELEGAKQRTEAKDLDARRKMQLASQRREESRKLLLAEESRVSKLEKQNKMLASENDKLKQKVHTLLGSASAGGRRA